MTLIDYAKYLFNVCGRRFTHLYRRHYLESTPTLPSLSALLSYLKTQTASIYAHLFSRGCTQSTPTFANLLPTLQQLMTRRVEWATGSSPLVDDGISFGRLLFDKTQTQSITAIVDDGEWDYIGNSQVVSIFPNLVNITLGIKKILGGNLITNLPTTLQTISLPKLTEINGGYLFIDSNYSMSYLTTISVPNLIEIVTSDASYNQAVRLYGFSPLLQELHFPKLVKVHSGAAAIGYYTSTDALLRLYFDGIDNGRLIDCRGYNSKLQYIKIGYTNNGGEIFLSDIYGNYPSLTDIEFVDGFCNSVHIDKATSLTAQNIYDHILCRLKQDEEGCGDGVTINLGTTNLNKLTSAESIAKLAELTDIYGYTFA